MFAKAVVIISGLLMAHLMMAQAPGKSVTEIDTGDITRFWEAYDLLAEAKTKADSVDIFQTYYLDRASEGSKKFIKVRNLTAERYANVVHSCSVFWESIRQSTLQVGKYIPAINGQFEKYRNALDDFKQPRLCFAIGVLTTGGTVKDGWLLLGTEMMVADSATRNEMLNPWLRNAMGNEPKVLEFVAHETVHAQQHFGPGMIWSYLTKRLLTLSIIEGSADFVAELVTGNTINEEVHHYGNAHEAELKADFALTMYTNDIKD